MVSVAISNWKRENDDDRSLTIYLMPLNDGKFATYVIEENDDAILEGHSCTNLKEYISIALISLKFYVHKPIPNENAFFKVVHEKLNNRYA